MLPVVGRELLVSARKGSTYWSRALFALAAIGLGGMVVSWTSIAPSTIQGGVLLSVLSSLAFIQAAFFGVAATSDCLSEEKRQGTLGLLFLTDLKGYDIVLGKMAVSSLRGLYGLLAALPVLSLSLLLGGITLGKFASVSAVLVLTLFLSLSLGVYVSSRSIHERKAMFATLVAIIFLLFGPVVLEATFSSKDFFDLINRAGEIDSPSSYSPLGLLVATLDFHGGRPEIIKLGLIFCCLTAFSLWLLHRATCLVRQSLDPAKPSPRFEKIRVAAGAPRRPGQWLTHRARLLDLNPIYWLTLNDPRKPGQAWGFVIGVAVIWLISSVRTSSMRGDFFVAGLLLWVTHAFFKVWVASEISERVVQDRRSGALELLLCTPLTVRDYAGGIHLALRRLFFKPCLLLMALDLGAIFFTGDHFSSPNGLLPAFTISLGLIVFWVDLWAMKWTCLGQSMSLKHSNQALLRSVGVILVVPWLWLVITPILSPSIVSSFDYQVQRWFSASILVSVGCGAISRGLFFRNFHAHASANFDGPATPQPSYFRRLIKGVCAPASPHDPCD